MTADRSTVNAEEAGVRFGKTLPSFLHDAKAQEGRANLIAHEIGSGVLHGRSRNAGTVFSLASSPYSQTIHAARQQ